MLPKLFEAISQTSYNICGRVVLLLFFLCGVFFIPTTNYFDLNTNLRCGSSKEITSSQEFVELTCFSKYKAIYHWRISFGVLVVFNFALILALSIFYAAWAKPRIKKWDGTGRQCNDATENNKDISLFHIYTSHLLTRFVLLLLFAAVLFYPINFPTNFSCPWRHPQNNIPCVNIMAAKKMNLAKAVAIIDVIFALFALVEVIYIFWWKRRNEEFGVFDDMEFCSVYILDRRGSIGSIINKIRDSQREDNNFFIKLMIQENRSDDDGEQMHEIYDVPLCKRKHRINNIEDIFKPIKNQSSESTEIPRRILIVGRPGIGKTALTKRILQQWKSKTVDFWKGKLVIRFAFRTFNHEENQKLSLSTLLSYGDRVTPGASGERLEDLYQFIKLNQKKVILVFDGLDELDVDLERCWQEEEDTHNETELNMSIFSLYVKLIQSNFFPEVTIVTTTRRTAEEVYRDLNFDKKLEILGFTEAEIEDYVVNCPQYGNMSQEIWGIIKQSAELLSICYIPVSCEIVCSTLKESIPFQKQGSVALTITEIYRRHITTMLYKHHKLFKGKRKEKGYILPETELPDQLKNDLSRLAKIAKLALDDKWNLVFKLDKDSSNLENCGLLVKEEDKYRHLYSFPHLTIQEYLAAVHIFRDVDNMADFLSRNIKVARWHLVIQFLAGLIGNEIRLLRGKELEMDELSRRKKDLLVKIVYDGFVKLVIPLKASEKTARNIALLAVKCVHEIQDDEIRKNAAQKLDSGGNRVFNLCKSNIAPLDCRGLFQSLIHVQNLRKLNLAENQISDHGVIELCHLLRENHLLYELDISSNLITDAGITSLCGVLTGGGSSLYHLNVSGNRITEEGIRVLCEALKHANCKLTYLDLGWYPDFASESYKHICDALKHKNCKLTFLSFSPLMRELSNLCEALAHGNCNLETLDIGCCDISGARRQQLEQASRIPNFQLLQISKSSLLVYYSSLWFRGYLVSTAST